MSETTAAVGPVIDPRRHDAAIFDMDGVVTDSAAIHAAAWAELFDSFLAARVPAEGEDHSAFSEDDYERYVDGKPRYDGVTDFLAARGISLPKGQRSDLMDAATVCGLGNRKDHLFLDRVGREGVPAFGSTVALVRLLHGAGVATAVFSASRNCAQVLAAAGVGDLFTVRVDGLVAEELGLPGKPDPAMLLEAARRLGADPQRTVVVEDAEAGVAAGRRGGFGLVVGVNRADHADRLRAGGADTVVADLAEVSVRGGFPLMSDVPDALESWPRIGDLLDTEKAAVLLDFDGTLSDIVAEPGAAAMVQGAAAALTELAAVCPVAIISGRDLADLRQRVGVEGLWYSGSHGFELMAPDGTRHLHEAAPTIERALAAAARTAADRLHDIAGVLVEHKRFAVAVHYRNTAPEQVGGIVATVHEIAEQAGLRITHGRMVVELRPDMDWDKGRALRWILDHLGKPVLPIYAGDDLTDEDAFDAVASDGIAIVVRDSDNRDRRTAARFAVDSPARMGEVLDRLADLLANEPTEAASDSWMLTYDGYDPATETLREALCALGNGYFATRAASLHARAGDGHYPGTYIAGVYDRLFDDVGGRTVDNESLVNLPNWLPVWWRAGDGDWLDPDTAEVLSYRQQLDLRRAVLIRRFRVRDDTGRITSISERRLVAMHIPHAAAQEVTIVAENWSGPMIIRCAIDTAVRNVGVPRYAALSGDHLARDRVGELSPDSVLAVVRTVQSHVSVAIAMRSALSQGGETFTGTREFVDDAGMAGHQIAVDVRAGVPLVLDKTVAVYTSRDRAICAPEEAAARLLDGLGGVTQLLDGHNAAWQHLWARLRIDLDRGDGAVRVLRLHLLHLVQTLSPHIADLDVGVPARGLHGEAYRGHVFWDELFVFPVLNLRFPTVTRALLHYRYRRLPQARRAARENGWTGAMFPWQSGSDGREESQQLHLNPRSGHWNPDPSRRAYHIGSAVAYNVWQYYQGTGDREFLADTGAELLVEIARFWASIARYDAADDRYHIRGVIGPDEFHTGYHEGRYSGVDDNAYTNVMAAWVLRRAVDALDLLAPRQRAEFEETLAVSPAEPARWAEVARRMFVPFHDGVISQFDRYHELAELDWDRYRRRYSDIQRLDRILEAENDDVNRYRVAKQADVLMLFYLLSAEELRDLLAPMGYRLPAVMIRRTVEYYLARTTHGSTLSAVVHAWVLARADRSRALEFFDTVLASDVADIQGGTTAEGIHLGAMAGSADLLQRCFTGLETRGDRLIFAPHWPGKLGALTFPLIYRGHRLTIRVSGHGVEVGSEPGSSVPITVECHGQTGRLTAGDTLRLPIR